MPGAETVDTFAQADAGPPPSALSAIATLPPTGTWAVAARCAVLAEGAMALVAAAAALLDGSPGQVKATFKSALRCAAPHARVRCRL